MRPTLRSLLAGMALVALAGIPANAAPERELELAPEDIETIQLEDLESSLALRSGSTYWASIANGRQMVPQRSTFARGLMVMSPRDEGQVLRYDLWVAGIRNVVEAGIYIGPRGENGEKVATIYGPAHPGGGYFVGKLAGGHLDAHDLEGPLADGSVIRLIAALESGDAYVRVDTDDGRPGDNTRRGDYIDGEIRGQLVRFGPPFPLPNARLQVIHNAADPGAAVVDVWVDGDKLLDDFAFRAATPYIDAPAGVELAIGVAPPDSDEPTDALSVTNVTLMPGGSYVVLANGVLDPAGFQPNPDGRSIGFQLLVKDMTREAAMDAHSVEFFAVHGATDAPTVDVIARGVATLVDNAAYGDRTGYLAVPPADYLLDVTPGDDNSTIVATFAADLSGLAGGAAVVFASGFLTPDDDQGGPAFGLFAALPGGAVVELPVVTTPREPSGWAIYDEGTAGGQLASRTGADGFGFGSDRPDRFELSTASPNPVRNARTTIAFALPKEADVQLVVFDILGRVVDTPRRGTMPAGRHQVDLDTSRWASGVYFYQLVTPEFRDVRKMVIAR